MFYRDEGVGLDILRDDGDSGDVYRIVLTWGEAPNNLNSHMVGPDARGKFFHVSFGSGAMSGSGAAVRVYRGDTLLAPSTCPPTGIMGCSGMSSR